jgi:cytochrome c-type biogenesis protein CcmH/NrfG
MRRIRIFATLFAVMAIQTSAASPAEAQAGGAAVREKTVTAPSRKPAEAQPPRVRRDTANASESVSERLFDAGWVIFPARLALVIVFLTIALFLLMLGTWIAIRVAHSLRHMKWSQPPRRLKRGEVGAAGTSFALEFEERVHENLQQDAERDQQLASLSEIVAQLSKDQNAMAATVAAMLTASRKEVPDGSASEG